MPCLRNARPKRSTFQKLCIRLKRPAHKRTCVEFQWPASCAQLLSLAPSQMRRFAQPVEVLRLSPTLKVRLPSAQLTESSKCGCLEVTTSHDLSRHSTHRCVIRRSAHTLPTCVQGIPSATCASSVCVLPILVSCWVLPQSMQLAQTQLDTCRNSTMLSQCKSF